MMTFHQGADARETYRETAGVSVSRLGSAVQGREANEATGCVTVTASSHTVVTPLVAFGATVHVPYYEPVAVSEVVGDVPFVQTFGLSSAAKSARTSIA